MCLYNILLYRPRAVYEHKTELITAYGWTITLKKILVIIHWVNPSALFLCSQSEAHTSCLTHADCLWNLHHHHHWMSIDSKTKRVFSQWERSFINNGILISLAFCGGVLCSKTFKDKCVYMRYSRYVTFPFWLVPLSNSTAGTCPTKIQYIYTAAINVVFHYLGRCANHCVLLKIWL